MHPGHYHHIKTYAQCKQVPKIFLNSLRQLLSHITSFMDLYLQRTAKDQLKNNIIHLTNFTKKKKHLLSLFFPPPMQITPENLPICTSHLYFNTKRGRPPSLCEKCEFCSALHNALSVWALAILPSPSLCLSQSQFSLQLLFSRQRFPWQLQDRQHGFLLTLNLTQVPLHSKPAAARHKSVSLNYHQCHF